ncbi:MAG: BREX-1 system phosphatase PglZ type A [Bacillota bacterium]|nr:BREX-1 system phosphatase PglZ type A [Bacillota bacterium]
MAELSLKQIIDKLNTEFSGSVRQLIFWYDANAEFDEDIDSMELDNAKVLRLAPDNQFFTKYFLECVDTETNYLVYAPFAKPSIRDNHLADTVRYSKEFFADRASLLTLDLGIDERYKSVIQKYIKFFAAKDRTQRFYDLELDAFNRSTIEVGLMSVLCKNKTASFEDVVRCILVDHEWAESPYLAEFSKYGLLEAFWQQVDLLFGYSDENPKIKKLAMTLFATYASKCTGGEVPKAWQPFVSSKSGNVVAFLDNLMNNFLYSDRFDEISADICDALGGENALKTVGVDWITECNLFQCVDKLIVEWMAERLENEDVSAKLGGKDIQSVISSRLKMHFASRFESHYKVLEAALAMLTKDAYIPVSGVDALAKKYAESLCEMDRLYRTFYYYLDKIDVPAFEKLRELIENLYTNDYLNKLIVNWNTEYSAAEGNSSLPKQTSFYTRHIKYAKERTVVIISDALRYEVGKSLFERFLSDPKCKANISYMMSTLPSYTRLGMAALLPHKELTLCENGDALCDGYPTNDLKQREVVLQADKPNSRCVQFDDLRSMKQADLREVFTGQDTVYIYHNQIDARGDKPNTENEVFTACQEAIDEIFAMIKRLTTSANTVHFIVTADHGFIYKRDKLTESDKISGMAGAAKRYLVYAEALSGVGISSIALKNSIGGNDDRHVIFPMGSDLFKAPGSGLNYVHGGSSPQELLIPVIDIRTEKAKKETVNAAIAMVSMTNRITNLITTLDFVQTEPVSDVVKEAKYRAFFVNSNGDHISNEVLHTADKTDKDAAKRVFRLKFSFKNQKYDTFQKYYLVVVEDSTNIEILRHEVLMDLAFADDFGFDL